MLPLANCRKVCYNTAMNTVRLNAYAKLNLTLSVTGRKEEYHTLDSLVTTIDLFDRIVVKKRKDDLISVTMRGMNSESISPEENNALRAGEAFVSRFRTHGAEITIYKNIPVGAGLGGSSADAAGVLNAMAKLYGITDRKELKEVADTLGSDTGFLLDGGFARMTGRGTEIGRLENIPRLHFLLLCPKEGVSTAECYREYDKKPVKNCNTEQAIARLRNGDVEGAAKYFCNDLYEAAARLNESVARALAEAESFSPWAACMTGSGSAVFALFETPELCAWAKSRYRGKSRALVVKTTEKRKTHKNIYSIDEEEN